MNFLATIRSGQRRIGTRANGRADFTLLTRTKSHAPEQSIAESTIRFGIAGLSILDRCAGTHNRDIYACVAERAWLDGRGIGHSRTGPGPTGSPGRANGGQRASSRRARTQVLRLGRIWLNYRVFVNQETEYGKSRQTKEGTEKTQKAAGSETGTLSKGQSPQTCGLSFCRAHPGHR